MRTLDSSPGCPGRPCRAAVRGYALCVARGLISRSPLSAGASVPRGPNGSSPCSGCGRQGQVSIPQGMDGERRFLPEPPPRHRQAGRGEHQGRFGVDVCQSRGLGSAALSGRGAEPAQPRAAGPGTLRLRAAPGSLIRPLLRKEKQRGEWEYPVAGGLGSLPTCPFGFLSITCLSNLSVKPGSPLCSPKCSAALLCQNF